MKLGRCRQQVHLRSQAASIRYDQPGKIAAVPGQMDIRLHDGNIIKWQSEVGTCRGNAIVRVPDSRMLCPQPVVRTRRH